MSQQQSASSAAVSQHHASTDGRANTEGTNASTSRQAARNNNSDSFGKAQQVSTKGSFPDVGSVLGPYFCLGQLGQGTFSSIHKCVNLRYFSSEGGESGQPRFVAAKVEPPDLHQSGVLGVEAAVLEFLDSSLPSGTVPKYFGHYTSSSSSSNNSVAALCMEYFPGADLNQVREQRGGGSRRLALQDAVLLTADVLLPLLRRMHEVGIVHRDVKPSNCVRKQLYNATQSVGVDDFCLVDFGLSKTILVAEKSEMADTDHPWPKDRPWMKPTVSYNGGGACYRKERAKADFRGTSMYASLRVHQGYDYCPRDDMWSLLYVFCDLATGGLPWMSNAAAKDRASCERLKTYVQGEDARGSEKSSSTTSPMDRMRLLLKGDAHHIGLFRRDKGKNAKVDPTKLVAVPPPLALSEDDTKVQLLIDAFGHLAKLKFTDIPDYDFLAKCIRGFLLNPAPPLDRSVKQLIWTAPKKRKEPPDSPDHQKPPEVVPTFRILELEENDPLCPADIEKAEQESSMQIRKRDEGWSRLPLQLRLYVAQLENHLSATSSSSSSSVVPPHVALQDWMSLTLRLIYAPWDTKRCEDGGHRTSTDGFKRERYLKLLRLSLAFAKAFEMFTSRDCYYCAGNGKRRRVITSPMGPRQRTDACDMMLVARAIVALQLQLEREGRKKAAPPQPISFG